jgi:hypothetical protein
MSKVSYDLEDIFSLLICAEVYGFGNDLLYKSLIQPIEVSKSHIDKYVSENYPGSDFSKEEVEDYKKLLVELFKMYKD